MRRPPPLLGVFTFVAVAAVVAPGWGCIAFIHDDAGSYSTTCPFEGEDSSCGECVQTSCAGDLDACCSDDACAPSLTLLDSCAGSGDLSACTSLANLTNVDAVEAALLGSCIQQSCTMCGTRGGTTITDGGKADVVDMPSMFDPVDAAPEISCLGGDVGTECVCTAGGIPTGDTCNVQLVGSGLCCAAAGWPTAFGAECSCKPFVCTESAEEDGPVTCTLAESSLGGPSVYPSPDSTADPTCCSDGLSCTCANDQSCGSKTETFDCDVSTVTCPTGTKSVTTCSPD